MSYSKASLATVKKQAFLYYLELEMIVEVPWQYEHMRRSTYKINGSNS